MFSGRKIYGEKTHNGDDDVIHKQFHILNTIFSVLSLHA